ncbi:MAG: hypothetical protein EOS40_36555, partial [Mesorhizobium sp.]
STSSMNRPTLRGQFIEPGFFVASNVGKVSAAPHPPAGTFSPYSDGEKEDGRGLGNHSARRQLAKSFMTASFSPSLYGEKCPAGQ